MKNKKKAFNAINRVLGEFSDDVSKDLSSAEEYLREQGVDPDEIANKALKRINFAKFKLEANEKLIHNKELLEKAINKIKDISQNYKSEVQENLKNILVARAPAFQFRNLKDWSDDQIRSVLEDVDLLGLIDDIEKEL